MAHKPLIPALGRWMEAGGVEVILGHMANWRPAWIHESPSQKKKKNNGFFPLCQTLQNSTYDCLTEQIVGLLIISHTYLPNLIKCPK